MDAMDKLTMDLLKKKYPQLPSERLTDLQQLGATEEQMQKANDTAKADIDKRLKYSVLEDENGKLPHVAGPRLRVAVIGATGSGKSATGNTLLKQKSFPESSGAVSETREDMTTQSQFDPLLTVVDTAGSWKLPKVQDDRIDLYIFVVNLASPRFGDDDLKKIRSLKDYNQIVNSKRCVLLLTHSKEALHEKSLDDYIIEIEGDPLYKFIVDDMKRWRVMGINNQCETQYEEDKQHDMIMNIMRKTYENASFQSQSSMKGNLGLLVFLGLIVIALIIFLAVYYSKEITNITTTEAPRESTTIFQTTFETASASVTSGTVIPATGSTESNVTFTGTTETATEGYMNGTESTKPATAVTT